MSDTKIDMPKVAQMLDAGWAVMIEKNEMGSYSVFAAHPKAERLEQTRAALIDFLKRMPPSDYRTCFGQTPFAEAVEDDFDGSRVVTDDFTPEQALTRMAYKVFGEIL